MKPIITSMSRPDTPLGVNRKSKKRVCSSFRKYSKTATWAARRVQFCLSYQGQYLLDQTNLKVSDQSAWLTIDPNQSLRFMEQDVAIARAQALKQQG
ncbi:hypothetical protein, partial [Synechococcus sp.]